MIAYLESKAKCWLTKGLLVKKKHFENEQQMVVFSSYHILLKEFSFNFFLHSALVNIYVKLRLVIVMNVKNIHMKRNTLEFTNNHAFVMADMVV